MIHMEPWQQLVIDALDELCDGSFQERVWLRREGDGISCPVETVNQLFDDSGLSDLLDDGVVFSDVADATLKRLGELIDTIDFRRPIEELLADPDWQRLRQLAFQARREVSAALRDG